jgi:hypothetical protein
VGRQSGLNTKEEGKQEEEGATRPSPTASFLEAYHAAPSPPTLRYLVARRCMLPDANRPFHTSNLVNPGANSCSPFSEGKKKISSAELGSLGMPVCRTLLTVTAQSIPGPASRSGGTTA